jgi:hypothetical protein
MKKHNIPFDSNGIVKLATKQGKLEKPRDTEYQQKLKDICLNCKKKKCRGCPQDKRFKKQRTLTDKELV